MHTAQSACMRQLLLKRSIHTKDAVGFSLDKASQVLLCPVVVGF